MLGTKDQPSLLVDIGQEHSPTNFEFWVVNGAWEGTFKDGYITIHHPWNPHSSLEKVEILSNNQDRLRGEYQEVFDNFHNPDYVAPVPKGFVAPAGWDDDIAF